MDIHITVKGQIVDLKGFFEDEMKCYSQFLVKYHEKEDPSEFLKFAQGTYIQLLISNPDLNKAIYDFYNRLCIDLGQMKPPENNEWLKISPVQADQFISASEAARRKNVSHTSIKAAALKGKIAGHKEKSGILLKKTDPGGQWKLSSKSVEEYQVNLNKPGSGKPKV